MRRIRLAKEGLACEVLPEYGGMVSGLWVDGVQTLRMNEGMLGLGNVLSGGIPLLFPFASRCRDDQIVLDGKAHFMPMHGFAKDLPFEVVKAEADLCELRLSTGRYPPCDARLTLSYRLVQDALCAAVLVENLGEAPFPMALGFHPYFRVEDRARAALTIGLRKYWDYTVQPPRLGALDGALDLTREWDHVFFGGGADALLLCPAEGYGVRLRADDTFRVVTLCTTQPGAVCVEPWQALPDPLNRGGARWVAPGEKARFEMRATLWTMP